MPVKQLLPLLLGAALIVAAAGFAGAVDYKDVETSTPQEVIDAMASKGVRSVANIATGWLEFPKQIYVTSRESGWPRGVVIGPVKGIGMALVRTVTGVGELATFFIPYPGFFDPWFEPAYVWQKE